MINPKDIFSHISTDHVRLFLSRNFLLDGEIFKFMALRLLENAFESQKTYIPWGKLSPDITIVV